MYRKTQSVKDKPKPSTGKLKESVNAQPSTRSSVRKSPGKTEKFVNESKPSTTSSTRKSPVKPSSRTSTRQSPRQNVTNDKSKSPTLFDSTYITYENRETNLIIKKISEKVKTNETQHFYLYHKSQPSNKYFVKTPDGTLQDLIQNQMNTEYLKNLLMQMFILILTLHHFGIRKKNFDIPDISYYKTDNDSKSRYFHYNIFNQDYYIKNDGYILILSDLTEIEQNNYEQSYETKTKDEREAENDEDGNFEDEYGIIIEFFDKIENKTIKQIIERIKKMKTNDIRYQTINSLVEEHNFLKKVFLLLYQNPIANDTPYIIHDDRMTFFDYKK